MKKEIKSNGWLKLYRAFKNNKINKSSFATHIWINLLIDAHWNKNSKEIAYFVGRGHKIIKVKRGQLVLQRVEYADKLGMSRPTLNKWLKVFEEEDMITTITDGKVSIVTIVNFQKYQQT